MSWIWWLILGMLIGWVVEWAIDIVYWRRQKINEASAVQASIRTLKTELASAQKENQRLQSESKGQPKPTQIVATAPTITQEQYDVLAAKLETAYADQQRIALELTAARNAAQQQQDTLAQLETSLTDCRTNKEVLQSELNKLKPQSTVNPMQTVVLPAVEVERALADYTPPQPERRDPLIDINGIGPVYEQRLFDAGIFTFEQLAALSPERIATITKAKDWQATDAEAWIAEAQQRAQQRDRSDTP